MGSRRPGGISGPRSSALGLAWTECKESEEQRGLQLIRTAEDPRDDPSLNQHLEPLGDARGELTPPLHQAQVVRGEPPQAQGFGEQVRRGDRVLDREVDADAADRGHRVGGVPDAEQARPVPPAQAVDTDREQLHVLPIADLSLTTGGERREPHHIAAECLEPTLADLLD